MVNLIKFLTKKAKGLCSEKFLSSGYMPIAITCKKSHGVLASPLTGVSVVFNPVVFIEVGDLRY